MRKYLKVYKQLKREIIYQSVFFISPNKNHGHVDLKRSRLKDSEFDVTKF